MPPKYGLVNFFRIHGGQNFRVGDFLALVRQAEAIPDAPQRERPVGDHLVRLQSVHVGANGPTLEIVKIRTHDLPAVITQNRELAELDGAGLAEHTVVQVIRDTNVVAVMRSAHGPSIRAVVAYFQTFANGQEIEAEEVLGLDAQDRFDRMTEVKKLSFKVAGIRDINALQGLPPDVEDVVALMRRYGGGVFDLDMNGKRAAAMNEPHVKQLATRLIANLGRNHVKRLRLDGWDDDGHPTPVDLITDRLYVRVAMDFREDGDREHRRAVRHQAVEQATGIHINFLRAL